MKIAVDVTVLYIAGAGVFYYRFNLVKALLDLGSQHEFVLLDYSPVEGDWIRHDREEVEELLTTARDVRRIRGLKHRKSAHVGFIQRHGIVPLAKWLDRRVDGAWKRLARIDMNLRLRRHLADVDVFHSSDVISTALPKAANVATIYDLTTLLYPDYHMQSVRALHARKLQYVKTRADAVIAISENSKRDVVKHLGVDAARVHVVFGGVDASYGLLPAQAVQQAVEPHGLEPQGYILSVGTLEPRKNLVRLIQAYGRARHTLKPTPRLALVGMKGWQYEEILEQVRTLDLEDEVTFLGRVPSELLPYLYNGARLFVYPSIYEGFGLPVLEAMACGVPVVTSNASSLPEVAGDAALLVDPYDVEQIAAAMRRMLIDEDQRSVLRQRGLKRAAQFSWATAASKTLEVYEKAAEAR